MRSEMQLPRLIPPIITTHSQYEYVYVTLARRYIVCEYVLNYVEIPMLYLCRCQTLHIAQRNQEAHTVTTQRSEPAARVHELYMYVCIYTCMHACMHWHMIVCQLKHVHVVETCSNWIRSVAYGIWTQNAEVSPKCLSPDYG